MENKELKKAQKKLIKSMYCYQMYFPSACVKYEPKLVTKIVKELSSDASRRLSLRRNIEI